MHEPYVIKFSEAHVLYHLGQTQLVIFGGFNENKNTTSGRSEHRAHTGPSGQVVVLWTSSPVEFLSMM